MDKILANTKVKFASYYKYTFYFKNDSGYEVSAGGVNDEIYRSNIEADKEYTIREVADECGGSLRIYSKSKLLYKEEW